LNGEIMSPITVFRAVMQQGQQAVLCAHGRVQLSADPLHDDRMFGDGEGMLAFCLAVPSRHTGQAVGDVLDFHIHGRGVDKVQPSSGQHTLPDPGSLNGLLFANGHSALL
jgi:hypothetical protein